VLILGLLLNATVHLTLESLSRVKTNAYVAPHRDYDLITLVVSWASVIFKVLSLPPSLMIMQHSLRHADKVGTVDLDVYSFKEGVQVSTVGHKGQRTCGKFTSSGKDYTVGPS